MAVVPRLRSRKFPWILAAEPGSGVIVYPPSNRDPMLRIAANGGQAPPGIQHQGTWMLVAIAFARSTTFPLFRSWGKRTLRGFARWDGEPPAGCDELGGSTSTRYMCWTCGMEC